MFCPKCGHSNVTGGECPKCGISVSEYLKKQTKQTDNTGEVDGNEPRPNAVEPYTLILKSINKGCYDAVAKKFTELTKKDAETIKQYLVKLPLTLGKKFTQEKALYIKKNLEAVGGVVDSSPELKIKAEPVKTEQVKTKIEDVTDISRAENASSPNPKFLGLESKRKDSAGEELEKKKADAVPEEAAALWNRAYKLHYNVRDVAKAHELYGQIIELYPDSPEAGYARQQIKIIEKKIPPEISALATSGKVAIQAEPVNQQNEASPLLEEALKLHHNLKYKAGDLDKAKDLYKQIIEHFPDSPEAKHALNNLSALSSGYKFPQDFPTTNKQAAKMTAPGGFILLLFWLGCVILSLFAITDESMVLGSLGWILLILCLLIMVGVLSSFSGKTSRGKDFGSGLLVFLLFPIVFFEALISSLGCVGILLLPIALLCLAVLLKACLG